jgi:hypothetical protein
MRRGHIVVVAAQTSARCGRRWAPFVPRRTPNSPAPEAIQAPWYPEQPWRLPPIDKGAISATPATVKCDKRGSRPIQWVRHRLLLSRTVGQSCHGRILKSARRDEWRAGNHAHASIMIRHATRRPVTAWARVGRWGEQPLHTISLSRRRPSYRCLIASGAGEFGVLRGTKGGPTAPARAEVCAATTTI